MSLDRPTSRAVVALVFAASVAAAGCKDAPPPPPAATPAPPAGDGGLRPLTSRDTPPAGGPAAPGGPMAPGGMPEGPAPSLPPGHPPLSGAPRPAGPADPATAVSGTASLAPSFQSRVAPTDVLYVIARNAKTNTVVAVRRVDGVRFPQQFEISSADVMMEGVTFSGPFDIVVRVSKTGDAIPGKGDLEGTVKGVAAGARAVAVTIDSVRQ
jgi:cytochrome c-type biogenesis protein CcmH